MRQSQLPVLMLHTRLAGHWLVHAVFTYPQLSLQLLVDPEQPAVHRHAPVAGAHVSPDGQPVHCPPQPLLIPQSRPPGQLGVQEHRPALHVLGAVQLPHEPPHPSLPH